MPVEDCEFFQRPPFSLLPVISSLPDVALNGSDHNGGSTLDLTAHIEKLRAESLLATENARRIRAQTASSRRAIEVGRPQLAGRISDVMRRLAFHLN
jgi:hypothetical protein